MDAIQVVALDLTHKRHYRSSRRSNREVAQRHRVAGVAVKQLAKVVGF
jgi:hypothetical protein